MECDHFWVPGRGMAANAWQNNAMPAETSLDLHPAEAGIERR